MDVPTKEREHARRWRNGNQPALKEHPGKDSGPNESKLSRRRGRSKAKDAKESSSAPAVGWSAWLGGGNWLAGPRGEPAALPGRTTCPGGRTIHPGGRTTCLGGQTIRPHAEMGGPGGRMTCPGGRTTRPSAEMTRPGRKDAQPPNGPKLSDRGWPSQAPNSEEARRPASVRWSALLGAGTG